MKTLTLGQFKTPEEYLKEIRKTRTVSSYAESVIRRVPVSKEKKKIEVALLTFTDLGLSGIKTTQEIKDAAQKLGYGLPDAEVALALALQEQSIGDWWITLHDPIKDSVGVPFVLYADRDDDGSWVDTFWARPGYQWYDNGAFAFLVPASTSSSNSQHSLETQSLKLRIEKIEKTLKSITEILSTL